MLYLATASGPRACAAIADGRLGQMVTPDTGNRIVPGARWVLDNGCFNARWTYDRWSDVLDRYMGVPGCLFAVAPDVVADADATDDLWARWWSATMRRGFVTAYVAQDGARWLPAGPGAVFIGGSTEWKLGAHARRVVAEAKRRGMWVHMGRVNTLDRLRYAADLGCDSVDGTFLKYGPDRNLPRLLRWLRIVDEPRLFEPMSVAWTG
jgi:hypothetical protein